VINASKGESSPSQHVYQFAKNCGMAVEYLKEYSKLLLVILIYQRFFYNVTMFCLLILFGRFEDFGEYGCLQIVL
jgi:hypothetical protein